MANSRAIRKVFRSSHYLWLTLAMFVVFAATFVVYVWSEREIDRTHEAQQQADLLADELRQSSDDLTRMVRSYVVTGNRIYKQHYQEILEIRDGTKPRPVAYHDIYWDLVATDNRRPRPPGPAVPLLELMRRSGFTEAEFAKLAEAKANSDALTRLEFAAMELIESPSPATEANRAKAVGMLFDTAYHDAKAGIMRPISEFYRIADQRTLDAIQDARDHARRMRIAFIVFGLMLLSLLWATQRNLHAMVRTRTSELDASLKRLQASEGALKANAELMRSTFEQAAVGIAHVDPGTYRILIANERFCSSLGYTQDELIGTDSRILTPQEEMPARDSERAQVLAGTLKTSTSERRLIRKDGVSLWFNRSLSLVRDLAGQPQYFISVIEDITERKRAEQLLALEHTVARCLAEANTTSVVLKAVIRTICETEGWDCGRYMEADEQAHVLRFSEGWHMPGDAIEQFIASKREAVFGPGVGMAGRTWQSGQPGWIADIKNDAGSLKAAMTLETGMDCAFHFPVISEGRTIGVLAFNSRTVREPDERLLQAVNAIGSQIGQFLQRKAAEDRIQYLATYDSLTSLPNRNMFHDRLALAIARAKRSGQMAALMFLDLDRFKEINDTLGHATGDKVLQATARLLRGSLREVDTISRLGGDEFTIVLENIVDSRQVKTIVEKITRVFSDPIITQEGRGIFVTASIGIALYPLDADNIDALLQAADVAMYRAKQEGRNTYEFYAPERNAPLFETRCLAPPAAGMTQPLELSLTTGSVDQPRVIATTR